MAHPDGNRSTRPVIGVLGAGASGTLTVGHIARRAARNGAALDIILFDPAPAATGVAYSSTDPRHRLNVPARAMSAWPDDSGHFLRWLRRHVSTDFPDNGFAPRLHYAQYLASVLDQAGRESALVSVARMQVKATDVQRIGRRLRVSLADGTHRAVDAVVLATGHGTPSSDWAPPALRRSPLFVADPWRTNASVQIGDGDEVLLIGAGLTAVDMALQWGRSGVRVHVVSRHGLLPLPHGETVQNAPLLPSAQRPETLRDARRFVFAAIRAAGGDWRRAIDGLRPVTTELWQGLDETARQEFLAGPVRRWERVRHRIDPALHAWLQERHTEGSLVAHAGRVTAAEQSDDRIRVTLSDGAVIPAALVINCTGPSGDPRTTNDVLTMNLLGSGFAQPGPLNLGLRTDGDGRLVSADGTTPAVWAIGPLRRGELWESTAIPEIRMQAEMLATQLVTALPAAGVRRRPRDPYGLPISASSPAAMSYVQGLNRLLRVQSGATELFQEAVRADHGFALGHAVLAVLGSAWSADVDIEACLAAAESSRANADERERRFIEVAAARVRTPGAESAAALLSYIQAYPEDALAVSLAVPTIAFGGATEIPAEAWALIEGLAPAYGDNWWYLSMLAFIRQEQERYDEAAEFAARALMVEPASGHAVHAKAHVHYETGDHRAGLRWLDSWIATCGAHASHRAHFSWHAGLHELALGDGAAITRRFADQLAPPDVTGVRALIDSASLLWRSRIAGMEPGGQIADVLEHVPLGLLTEPRTPFVALHAAVALAAAEDCRGLVRLRKWADQQPSESFHRTVSPLADALCDLVHGDAERALTGLLSLRGVEHLGGSAAQREVVEDTVLYAALEAGRLEVAERVLDDRLHRRAAPRERQLRSRLHAGVRTARTTS